jgi:hypothetical protein
MIIFIDIKVHKMSTSTSTSTSEKKETISVDHKWNSKFKRDFLGRNIINLQIEREIPVSCKEMRGAYTVFKFSPELYIIHIHYTDDYVVVRQPDQPSILLHVHIIERLCLCLDNDFDEDDWVVGIRLLCIFNDQIVEILVENRCFEYLGDQKVGFSLERVRTQFLFRTTHNELLLFVMDEHARTERLRAVSVLGQQVELFNVDFLVNADAEDGECFFNIVNQTFFILPQTIKVIEIDCFDNFFYLRSKLRKQSTEFQIYIYDGESNELDDEASPTFILRHFDERYILVKKDQLCKFQDLRFGIIATMYLVFQCDEDEEILKIQRKLLLELLLELLKLNRHRRSDDESDLNSGDDLDRDSDSE